MKVTGEVIGIGSDGEPLLNVKTVKYVEECTNLTGERERAIKMFAEEYNWTETQVKKALGYEITIQR